MWLLWLQLFLLWVPLVLVLASCISSPLPWDPPHSWIVSSLVLPSSHVLQGQLLNPMEFLEERDWVLIALAGRWCQSLLFRDTW